MATYNQINKYLDEHLDESIEELSTYAAQPSIAAQNLGLEECAAMTADMLRARGFDVKVISTPGAPVVFGERKGRSNNTLLFYNHYDVQPAEPLELWDSPPFEPTLRDGKLYARGVSDDKAHVTSRLFAIDALLDAEGELPCNIKFIIEGEEEISSVNLPNFIRDNAEMLAADACIWEFGGVNHEETPSQSLGMRGICYVEFSVETASRDAHSGFGGTIFPNAAWRLVWALNTLKGEDERVRIPGFYDTVLPATEREKELLAALPDIGPDTKERYGIDKFLLGVEGGAELRLQEVYQPSCTICGLDSGYQGEGSKTVLPAKAKAKVDFRLVPNQRPEKVFEQLRTHLDAEGFADVKIKMLGGTIPAKTDPDDPFVKLVMDAAVPVYGKEMTLNPMIGGSGPSYPFYEYLKVPVATSGVGYPGVNAHAPNENLRLDLYLLGAKHAARIMKMFGEE